jgi:flagellar M-ring protein FliF
MLQNFRTSPPPRQLALIAMTGAALCALLAIVYFAWLRTGYEVLYRDLREADAATIVAELDRTKTDYRLSNGGQTILVPEGDVDATRLHVAGQDLPLQGTVGFELFNNSSIGLTEFAQRINLQRALQGELVRTITSMEGVESARVHLSLGEKSIFRGERQPPRASVAVRTKAGRHLDGATVAGIQRLVAGSVPDLDHASVAVLDDRGAVVSAEAPEEEAAAEPGSEEQRNIQQFFEARIRGALESRYPADMIDATVWAAVSDDEQEAVPVTTGDAAVSGRNYRLRATVSIASTLSGAAHQQVTQAVRDAIGFDAALGDSVTVTASPPIATSDAWEAPGRAGIEAGLESGMPRPATSLWGSLWTPLALLALACLLLLASRRRGKGAAPMSERKRLAYVANLKALLAQRDADVAPSA